MIRGGLRPGIRIAVDNPAASVAWRRVFPFQKNWVVVGIVAAIDVAFLAPAVLTFGQAASAWSRMDNLFDLVIAIFLSAWLLGWATAPLILTVLLLVLLFGRETARVVRESQGNVVDIFIGLPFIGVRAKYDATLMRNLRRVVPEKKSGHSWRGPHVVFDYGGNQGRMGSDIDEMEFSAIKMEMESALGRAIRTGEASRAEQAAEAAAARKAKLETSDQQAAQQLAAEAENSFAPSVSGAIEPISLVSPSTLLLILANLVPLAGTVVWGWDLSSVMVLYWAESAVIGFFNILKMAIIGRWTSLFSIPFFLGHFGGFMAVHFLFIYTLFVKSVNSADTGALNEVGILFLAMWPALILLFISHGYSFYRNFLGRGEFRDRSVKDQMMDPYSRIIFMHLVLIFGGGLSMALGGPTIVLLIVIALKIVFDVRAHLKEHAK